MTVQQKEFKDMLNRLDAKALKDEIEIAKMMKNTKTEE